MGKVHVFINFIHIPLIELLNIIAKAIIMAKGWAERELGPKFVPSITVSLSSWEFILMIQ